MLTRKLVLITAFLASNVLVFGQTPARKNVAERLGYPADSRLLIIQADVGMMHSINRAAFEALEKHWITSATIVAPCPWFPEVAGFARSHADLDLGIHLALNSEWNPYRWGPVADKAAVASLLDPDGYLPKTEDEVLRRAKPEEVERELRAQIEKVRAAGISITHFDSHMGTLFGSPELFRVYQKLGREYRLPILVLPGSPTAGLASAEERLIDREIQMRPNVPPERWMEWYKQTLAALPAGVYQLTVHLGYDDDEARGATEGRPWGAAWRQHDTEIVGSAEFQQFLRDQRFVLVTWRQLSGASQAVSAPQVTRVP